MKFEDATTEEVAVKIGIGEEEEDEGESQVGLAVECRFISAPEDDGDDEAESMISSSGWTCPRRGIASRPGNPVDADVMREVSSWHGVSPDADSVTECCCCCCCS